MNQLRDLKMNLTCLNGFYISDEDYLDKDGGVELSDDFDLPEVLVKSCAWNLIQYIDP